MNEKEKKALHEILNEMLRELRYLDEKDAGHFRMYDIQKKINELCRI